MSKVKNQYSVRKINNGFNVGKYDEDLNIIETYTVQQDRGRWWCSCPNTMAKECRHMQMVPIFKKKRAVGKAMFYCFDTKEWTKIKEE